MTFTFTLPNPPRCMSMYVLRKEYFFVGHQEFEIQLRSSPLRSREGIRFLQNAHFGLSLTLPLFPYAVPMVISVGMRFYRPHVHYLKLPPSWSHKTPELNGSIGPRPNPTAFPFPALTVFVKTTCFAQICFLSMRLHEGQQFR